MVPCSHVIYMLTQLEPLIAEIDAALNSDHTHAPYAVFDFDDTCVMNDIQQGLMALMCREGLIRYTQLLGKEGESLSRPAYHEAVFHQYWDMIHRGVTFDAYVFALRTLVGYRRDEVHELYKRVLVDRGTEMGEETLYGVNITRGFRVNEPIRTLMTFLEERHVYLCVISASPQLLVEAALSHYAFPHAHCIGTQLHEKGDVFIDSLIEPAPVEHGKILCVQNQFGTDTHPLLGAGDTMNDFAMIEYAHIHVVVNRENQLTEEARKRGWHLITHS